MLTPEEGEKTNKQKDAIFLPKKKEREVEMIERRKPEDSVIHS